jgi:hypothetical protein
LKAPGLPSDKLKDSALVSVAFIVRTHFILKNQYNPELFQNSNIGDSLDVQNFPQGSGVMA